jgi:signal peptidase I
MIRQTQALRVTAPRTLAREVFQTAALMVLLFVGVRGLVQNFRVEGPSMQPTLATGQFLWVNKAAYFQLDHRFVFGGPERGDIAVLVPPDDQQDFDLIKRVIGLPGDTLKIDHGQVWINNQALDEPYIHFHAAYNFPTDGQSITIPDGQYFVLGDNRANSRDSHLFWFVPAENFVGRAWLSYWPPAAWGVMPGVAYATDATR